MSDRVDEIEAAAKRLRAGGVIAFPTETVYGLGVDARNEAAVQRVYDLKGRPAVKPLSVLVSGESSARRLVSCWPEAASRLAACFWPGPLTIVVERVESGEWALPEIVVAGGTTVGLRCPDHGLTLDLLRRFDGPIAGPSANRSGESEPTSAADVREIFADPAEVLILDGGVCAMGRASTVVRIDEANHLQILREGGIDEAALRDAL